MNTSAGERGPIWRGGMCIKPKSLVVVKRGAGSPPLIVGRTGDGTGPYKSARRVFWIVDNGSSHRGQKAVTRLQNRYANLTLVHGPVHASWLNQIEIYFSILQQKVLTPNDFPSLAAVAERLANLNGIMNRSHSRSSGALPAAISRLAGKTGPARPPTISPGRLI